MQYLSDEIIIGETFQRNIDWKDEDGNAVDLTGYTAIFQLINGCGVIFSNSSEDIPTAVTVNSDSIDIILYDATTQCFNPGAVSAYLQVTSPDGITTTYLFENIPYEIKAGIINVE